MLSPSAEVTKILSPQTHGVHAPMPGNLNFQTMFLSGPHSVGMPFSSECPSFFGPRHCGQLSAYAAEARANARTLAEMRRRLTAGNLRRAGVGGSCVSVAEADPIRNDPRAPIMG